MTHLPLQCGAVTSSKRSPLSYLACRSIPDASSYQHHYHAGRERDSPHLNLSGADAMGTQCISPVYDPAFPAETCVNQWT